MIPLHVRGGNVFPLQMEDLNTELSRGNNWRILAALDDNESATGELFMDDGITLDTIKNGDYLLVS